MPTADRSGHTLYWEEYGNPSGKPVIVLHGGPGGHSSPVMQQFFDPDYWRVLIADQRGCGKSIPSGTDNDVRPALAHNTTPHLINDIKQLRAVRGISGKATLFGGSFGATLALAAAIDAPETIERLVLRSPFLGRRQDVDFFYQGNAADPGNTAAPGAYQAYPDEWQHYVRRIPPSRRGDMVQAYHDILSMNPDKPAAFKRVKLAAEAWTRWQASASQMTPDPKAHEMATQEFARFALAFARFENVYFMNGSFLGGAGAGNRDNNYILGNAARLADIPVDIVHGSKDQVVPLSQGQELARALQHAGNTAVTLRVTMAGHGMLEKDNVRALTGIMDELARPLPIPVRIPLAAVPSTMAVGAVPA